MASSLNEVTLIGNVGRDPEVRYLPNGNAVCNITVATSFKRKSGEEDTSWHRVTLYEKLAEIAGEYLKKGRQVYIKGRIQYGKYTNKDGIEMPTTDIVASQMLMLGKGEERSEVNQATTAPAPRKEQRSSGSSASGSGFDDMSDDDIPF